MDNNKEFNLALQKFNVAKTMEECKDAVLTIQYLADKGCIEAQIKLGLMYYFGELVDKNLKESAYQFRRAAEAGHPRAQNAHGSNFYYGEGVAQDKHSALKWYKKSASQNSVQGLISLASCYYDGDCGLAVDKIMASKIFEDAKKLSIGNSQYEHRIHMALYDGSCCEVDVKSAIHWCFRAAISGNSQAQCDIGYYYEKNIIENDDTIINIADFTNITNKHIFWYEKSAKNGNLLAISNLSGILSNMGKLEEAIYWNNIGAVRGSALCAYRLAQYYDPSKHLNLKIIIKDINIAMKWYAIAAKRGYTEAYWDLICLHNSNQICNYKCCIDYCHKYIKNSKSPRTNFGPEYFLGQCYLYGNGTEKNYDMAISYLEIAAKSGHSQSQVILGKLLYNGINDNVKQDKKQALFWLEKASENNDTDAIVGLAEIYWTETAMMDKEKSIDLMKRAAINNYIIAQFNLGLMYSCKWNSGKYRNVKKSIKWYRKAVENNHTDAYPLLAIEIQNYIEHDSNSNIDIKEWQMFEKESLELFDKFGKTGKMNFESSLHNNAVNLARKFYFMPAVPRFVIGDSIRELTRHENILPFNRIFLQEPFNLKHFIDSKRNFTMQEIVHIGKQLCRALIHCQDNGFVVFKCNLQDIYILLPRLYELRQKYLTVIKDSSYLCRLPIDLLKMITDYTCSNYVDAKDVESEVFLSSRLIFGGFDNSISIGSSWILNNDESKGNDNFLEISRALSYSVAPELLNKSIKNFELANAYTLGQVLGDIADCGATIVDTKMSDLICQLLKSDPKMRKNLRDALEVFNSY